MCICSDCTFLQRILDAGKKSVTDTVKCNEFLLHAVKNLISFRSEGSFGLSCVKTSINEHNPTHTHRKLLRILFLSFSGFLSFYSLSLSSPFYLPSAQESKYRQSWCPLQPNFSLSNLRLPKL